MNKPIKNIIPIIKAALNPRSKIRWATLFITRKCNRTCPYCDVQKYNAKEISTEQWMLIIDRLSVYGVKFINIVGGEPTLRADLAELIQYISSKNIIVMLHSNFNDTNVQHIDSYSDAGLSILETSMDSFYNFGKTFSKEKIALLKYASNKGIIPIVSSVITSANASEIPKIAKSILQENIIYNCGLYQNIGGQFSPSSESLKPSYESARDVFNYLRILKRSGAAVKTSFEFLKESKLETYYYNNRWKCNPQKDRWIVINSDGNLMNCEEYASPHSFLETDILKSLEWRKYRNDVAFKCGGCYHHCYYEAEQFYPLLLFNEIKSIKNSFKII